MEYRISEKNGKFNIEKKSNRKSCGLFSSNKESWNEAYPYKTHKTLKSAKKGLSKIQSNTTYHKAYLN
jgi:hypothetical protein